MKKIQLSDAQKKVFDQIIKVGKINVATLSRRVGRSYSSVREHCINMKKIGYLKLDSKTKEYAKK